MVYAIETLPEESWTQAESLLIGKQSGHRVLVWVNYDILSLCKTFFLLEKSCGKLSVKDFPLPVFWDEETSIASNRLSKLQRAIDSYTFDDFPSYSAEIEEDDTWGNELELHSEPELDSEVSDGELEIESDSEPELESDSEPEEEKEELPEEYLKRQFEMYLKEVEEEYQPVARQTFHQHIESLVEKLKMNARR